MPGPHKTADIDEQTDRHTGSPGAERRDMVWACAATWDRTHTQTDGINLPCAGVLYGLLRTTRMTILAWWCVGLDEKLHSTPSRTWWRRKNYAMYSDVALQTDRRWAAASSLGSSRNSIIKKNLNNRIQSIKSYAKLRTLDQTRTNSRKIVCYDWL